jgi:poly-gamma-glutamate system protein
MRLPLNIRLLFVFGIFLAGFLIIQFRFITNEAFAFNSSMKRAVELSQEWFNIIRDKKAQLGIISDVNSNIPNSFLLGNDFTLITTTLGSHTAKEVSTNPDFAALMVRLLKEAGMERGDKAGVIISGSFPALAISSLAAIQVLEMEAVVISSLGASTFGANQERATWIDMETWLVQEGDLKYSSVVVSIGAENYRGEGLPDEGKNIIKKAAEQNHHELYIPENLMESIRYKTGLLSSENISILINIGGNQAALGGCPHASSLPNGLCRELKLCHDPDRGILQEMNANGIPVINLLNIKDLASSYGIDLSPGLDYAKSTNLFINQEPDYMALSLSLLAGFLGLVLLLIKKS